MKKWYLLPWVTAEERVREMADHAEKLLGVKWFSDKFYWYVEKGFYSIATPIWCNYWLERGLPISCFGSTISDSIEDILDVHWEVWALSKVWWWTAAYFGNIRSRWSDIKNNWKATWAVHFMGLFSKLTEVISQWSSRRGRFAAYLPIEHWDIMEFLDIASEWNPIQWITTAVTVTDKFMEDMIAWDEQKRKVRARVLQSRKQRWFPYIQFTDTANKSAPDVYWHKWLNINNSNLCSEIFLSNAEDETYVCCLSSMNLVEYNQRKDTDAVETMIYFLDSVITDFLNSIDEMKISKPWLARHLQKVEKFARNQRALWLWVLWRHSLLQSRMIAVESEEASTLNKDIHKLIRTRANKASHELSLLLWEPKLLEWYERRNSTVMSIAPTTSSSFLLGSWQVSQSIEPLFSNYYNKDLAKWSYTIKNKYLEKLLEDKWISNRDTRLSIRKHNWSVQHLNDLTQEEKNVFKNFNEIDQETLIKQNADRQKYIDQWVSFNLKLPTDTPVKEINRLHILAWELGLKSLYYMHSSNSVKETISKFTCDGGWCEA